VLLFAATLIGFVFSLWHLGFLVSGLWVTAVIIRLLGREPWWKACLASVVMVGVFYWFFASVLQVRFPRSTFVPPLHF
jgi:hypothetical protein